MVENNLKIKNKIIYYKANPGLYKHLMWVSIQMPEKENTFLIDPIHQLKWKTLPVSFTFQYLFNYLLIVSLSRSCIKDKKLSFYLIN